MSFDVLLLVYFKYSDLMMYIHSGGNCDHIRVHEKFTFLQYLKVLINELRCGFPILNLI